MKKWFLKLEKKWQNNLIASLMIFGFIFCFVAIYFYYAIILGLPCLIFSFIFLNWSKTIDKQEHIENDLTRNGNNALLNNSDSNNNVVSCTHKMSFKHLSLENVVDLNAQEYIVFDCETTGLEAFSGDRIIEFCLLKYKNGEIVDKLTSLVNPQIKLTAKIIEMTGINDNNLIDKPSMDFFINDIIKFINNQIIIGHNINFDINFLRNEIYRCKFNTEELNVQYIDTLEMVKKSIYDVENNKLTTLKNYFNIQTESHRAEADCIVTQEVYERSREILTKKITQQREKAENYKKREQNCLTSMNDDEKEIFNYFITTAKNHDKDVKYSFKSDKAISFTLCGIEIGRIKFNAKKHYCKFFAGDFKQHEWSNIDNPTKEQLLTYIDDLFIYVDKEYKRYFVKYGR